MPSSDLGWGWRCSCGKKSTVDMHWADARRYAKSHFSRAKEGRHQVVIVGPSGVSRPVSV
jgi:hypothetical protein